MNFFLVVVELLSGMYWRGYLHAIVISFSFPLSFYIFIRDSLKRSRNDVKIIQYRSLCALGTIVLGAMYIMYFEKQSLVDFLRCSGIIVDPLYVVIPKSIFVALIINSLLFLGPICFYTYNYVKKYRKKVGDIIVENDKSASKKWRIVRNYIIGPVSEEIIYRGFLFCVLKNSHPNTKIALAALLFSSAHLHHVIEKYLLQKRSFKSSILQISFQLFYTFIFSVYSGAMIVIGRCGIWVPVFIHAYCNYLEFPRFDKMATHKYKWFWLSSTFIGIISFFTGCVVLNKLEF